MVAQQHVFNFVEFFNSTRNFSPPPVCQRDQFFSWWIRWWNHSCVTASPSTGLVASVLLRNYSVFSVYIYLFIHWSIWVTVFFCTRRPPGHHAHADKMNGFCMFNNLAIAARYAQKQHKVKRWVCILLYHHTFICTLLKTFWNWPYILDERFIEAHLI